MNFKDALEFHRNRLEDIRIWKERGIHTDMELWYEFRMTQRWFRWAKMYSDDLELKLEMPTEEQSEQFKIPCDGCYAPTADNYIHPVAVLNYRGSWPVYEDDDGQCYYIIVEGQSWSGGTWCTHPELEFSDFIDDILDRAYFEK